MREAISDGPPLATLFADDLALEEFVRGTTMGIKHLSCTCRMGRGRSDGRHRAGRAGQGVAGLRVVDASIMPSLPRANTNLTTLMVAEKIADTMLAG